MGRTWESNGEKARAHDHVLANLYAAPFTLHRPAAITLPFVFASPHSGRLYPPSFIARSRLNALALRRSEDAFVDKLFAFAVSLGAPLIAARFPRAYLDANRAPSEIDAAMVDGDLPFTPDGASPRVIAGLGVIPQIVRDGAEIYRDKLTVADVTERLERLHKPYHDALDHLIEETRTRFGFAILIDCHSMPSVAAVPDIIIGDRQGLSACAQLTRLAERVLEAHAFTVGRNMPYAGGYTTRLYGRRDGPVQALQIEISRGLYLDEERIESSARYGEFATRLKDALTELTAADFAALGFAHPIHLAAE